MAPRYDEAPEVALHSYPEVHHPPAVPEVALYGNQTPSTPLKPEERTISPGYVPVAGNTGSSTYGYDHQSAYDTIPPSDQARGSKRVCGCSALVFILSIIIAVLSVAVIGLAAGTGVEASRANDAESRLAAMSASASATTSAPTSTSTMFSNIDKGCSTNSAGVTGTTYSSQWFNRPTFKIYCNSNAPNNPLQSLFVGNFDDCIDACASYTYYVPSDFSNSSTSNNNNATCAGISFIPLWTNRTSAQEGGAPGNCYLKPGPQNQTGLENPNIGGSAVHAAILQT
ncbi:hypothetical protein F5B20DRAFT_48892 [Whalleya microplaca]|nr:hypothetical protein F5B20DRAFT_48892 [Whalleya microplaca]